MLLLCTAPSIALAKPASSSARQPVRAEASREESLSCLRCEESALGVEGQTLNEAAVVGRQLQRQTAASVRDTQQGHSAQHQRQCRAKQIAAFAGRLSLRREKAPRSLAFLAILQPSESVCRNTRRSPAPGKARILRALACCHRGSSLGPTTGEALTCGSAAGA